MSDRGRLELDVVDRDGAAVAECPDCGKLVELYGDRKRHDCDGRPPFDGECAMCGEPYESYLEHLKDCDGGG